LSKQNSQVAHKLQTALTKKRNAESECAQAVAEATRQARLAAGAQCEARGLKAELLVLRATSSHLHEAECVIEASVLRVTAAMRAEILEIEVDSLTNEIVEERAIKAAAVHRCRIMYEDASRCAAEIGDLIQGFSIGLQSILSESEADTAALLKEHKKLLMQFVESEQVT
jgi:hypothetical protein